MEYTKVKTNDNSEKIDHIECFFQSSIKNLNVKIKNLWEIPIYCQ